MAIDIVLKQVAEDDVASKIMLNRTVPKTIRLILFGTEHNAQWAASRALRRASFPFREGQIEMHHSAFKSKVGDLIKISIPQYSIVDMVCRVMKIGFGDLLSEDLIIDWIEDPDYAVSQSVIPSIQTYAPAIDWSVEELDPVYILDAPYDFVGEEIKLLPLVGRKKGTEVGFELYISHDGGSSYIRKDTYQSYCIHGTLVEAITHHYPTITDKQRYITIDCTIPAEALGISTINRTALFANYNQAVLINGDNYGEIIAFQTVVPDDTVDGRIHLTGLIRGKFDTMIRDWEVGTDFFFLRPAAIAAFSDSTFFLGAEKYFKLLPYNNKFQLTLAETSGVSHTITGRGKAPFPVSNLQANDNGLDDIGEKPPYSTDIVLTWSPAVRSGGAGLGSPDIVVDGDPTTYEGLFEVEVWVASVKVRTASAIAALTWTYTEAMNLADNTSLASEVQFRVSNYLTSDSELFYSEYNLINVFLS
jgi:hypothetical protein